MQGFNFERAFLEGDGYEDGEAMRRAEVAGRRGCAPEVRNMALTMTDRTMVQVLQFISTPHSVAVALQVDDNSKLPKTSLTHTITTTASREPLCYCNGTSHSHSVVVGGER